MKYFQVPLSVKFSENYCYTMLHLYIDPDSKFWGTSSLERLNFICSLSCRQPAPNITSTSYLRLNPENDIHCRATLATSVAECKPIFGSACKTKLLDRTVKETETSLMNGRTQRSLTVDWNIQNRTQRVAVKMATIEDGKAAPHKIHKKVKKMPTTPNSEDPSCILLQLDRLLLSY